MTSRGIMVKMIVGGVGGRGEKHADEVSFFVFKRHGIWRTFKKHFKSNITKSGYCECNLLSFYLRAKINSVKQVRTKKMDGVLMLYASYVKF